MPQEFYGSFQNNVEREGASPFPTDEVAGQTVDYAHPEYYQPSEFASYQSAVRAGRSQGVSRSEAPVQVPSNDYTQPSHYGVFPYGGNKTQESHTPISVEENPGDEGQGETGQKGKGGLLGRLAGLGGLVVIIGGWLIKLKSLAFLLKFGTAGITALISVAFYSLALGWTAAFGFVLLIFVHEMGHVIAVKAKGLPVKGMLFIPFFGAAVSWSNAKNIKDEAEVAIAGPLAGAIGASICLGIVELFHLQHTPTIWLWLAYIGFFLNLVNLAPVWPLDGGRIFDAINRRVWIVGFVGLLGLQIWFWLQGNTSMWLLFLLILSGSRFLSHKQTPENGKGTSHNEAGTNYSSGAETNYSSGAEIGHSPGAGTSHSPYYEVSTSSRVALTILYFALAVVLFLGMTIAQSYMSLPPM